MMDNQPRVNGKFAGSKDSVTQRLKEIFEAFPFISNTSASNCYFRTYGSVPNERTLKRRMTEFRRERDAKVIYETTGTGVQVPNFATPNLRNYAKEDSRLVNFVVGISTATVVFTISYLLAVAFK